MSTGTSSRTPLEETCAIKNVSSTVASAAAGEHLGFIMNGTN